MRLNLDTNLSYALPEPAVPEGYTPTSYLRRLCLEAAQRRYGEVSPQVRERLDEEFRLIERHGLAGFLLLYREIVLLAQEIMQEQGLVRCRKFPSRSGRRAGGGVRQCEPQLVG